MLARFRDQDIDFFNFLLKFGIGAAFFLSFLGVIYIGLKPYVANLREGEVSLVQIYAPLDFSYPARIDEARTVAARKTASESASPVYDALPNAIAEARARLEQADSNIRANLSAEDLPAYKEKTDKILSLIYAEYIVDRDTKKALEAKKGQVVLLRDPRSFLKKTATAEEILTRDDIKSRFEKNFEELFPKETKLRSSVLEAVKNSIRPNLILNEEETKKAQELAAKSVPPIYEIDDVKKNELIIDKGQRITKTHIAVLGALNRIERGANVISYMSGVAFLLLVFIIIFYSYLRFTEPKTVESLKSLGITALLAMGFVVVCKTAALSPLPRYVVPFASVPMLLTILVTPNTAVISGVLLSIVAGIIFGGKFDVMLIFLVSGLVGIYSLRNLRSRFQIITAGIKVGISASAVIAALGMANNIKVQGYCLDCAWGLANGILSSFLVMGLLPLFEYLFKTSTNITLLELSDMSHPLLKELALKAPGTYLHSHLVGNLAEAACESIGANALLARIGSYYHDIGKIEKAEYFSENETSVRSKHERLKPSMSSLVIGNHVKEGVDLAQRYHLNRQIIDIIQQHHGTSLMYFFYKRALEEMAANGPLKEQDYRYLGPKPQTKEAAVVLLADSVEASSRTLSDPTPGKIRNMVQRIINNKFIDNQLDECDLTLRDLYKISEAFVRVLIAAFHVRTEYPAKA